MQKSINLFDSLGQEALNGKDESSVPRIQIHSNSKNNINILQDVHPSVYLKNLYENCPTFEENVPVYGPRKSNWLQMTRFILNTSTHELKKKWSMAQNYLSKK